MDEGDVLEPSNAYAGRFTVCSRLPLGYPSAKRAAYFDFGVPACQCGLARYLLGGGSPRGGRRPAGPPPVRAAPAWRGGPWLGAHRRAAGGPGGAPAADGPVCNKGVARPARPPPV